MILLYAYLLVNLIVTALVVRDWFRLRNKFNTWCILTYIVTCFITLLAGTFVAILPFVDRK